MPTPPRENFSSSTAPIIVKSYELLKFLYPIVQLFPKPARYTIGTELQSSLFEIVTQTTHALYARQPLKEAYILKSLASIQLLQLHVRLSLDLGYITEQRYFIMSARAVELNKMALGWLKATRAP